MAKDPYYFTHDANASSDPKILAMMQTHGVSGYGMFWIIVERLRNESGYKIADKQYNWDALAMQMKLTADKVKEFVNYCIDLDLFVMDEGFFYSPALLKRMVHLDDVRAKRSRAGEQRWAKEKGWAE